MIVKSEKLRSDQEGDEGVSYFVGGCVFLRFCGGVTSLRLSANS
jgi:hypothetical protein